MNWFFWLILVVVLTVIEVATVNLLTIWFVVSGIVSLILSFFIEDIAVVSSIFVILGIILLFLTRPIVKRLRCNELDKTNLERIIGATGVVTEKITGDTIGEIKLDGKRWSAKSLEKIDVGAKVKVEKIDGVKLIVKKEE